jgi:hypothetical protein
MKRGQAGIFVIIAILIVAVIALSIFIWGKIGVGSTAKGFEENPQGFLSSCIGAKVKNTAEKIAIQGGYLNPELYRNFKFESEKDYVNISYLCYNQNYYLPCINQHPMLIQNINKEIKKGINEEVEKCFNELKDNYKNKGYGIRTSDSFQFDVEIGEDKILVNIKETLYVEKEGESKEYAGFKLVFPNKLYNLAVVAQEITSQEARFCNFEQLGYMLIYREFDIDKFRTGDSDTIYTITDKDSKEKFRFAVRSCVIPPGI